MVSGESMSTQRSRQSQGQGQGQGHGRLSRPPPSREVEYRLIQDAINDICSTIKKYAQRFFTKRQLNFAECGACFRELVARWNLDSAHFVTWKDLAEKIGKNDIDKAVKVKETYADLVFLCDRAKEFEMMIPQVRENLVICVKEHVYKYCHSFAEETGGIDATVVMEYEEQIRNYKKDIEKKINSINADILRYSEVKTPLEKLINEGEIIGSLMEGICVQIVEISHEVKKWICDDAAYPDKLQQEILFNNGYKDTIHDGVVKLHARRRSLERSLERKKKVMKKTEKDYVIHRRDKRKRKESLRIVNSQIVKLESDIAQKSGKVEGTKTALSSRKVISPRQEEDMHLNLAKHLKEIERLDEWLTVAKRQNQRLEKEVKQFTDRTYELKVEVVTLRHEIEDMQRNLEGMDIELRSMDERLENLERKTTVMKHIRILKMSPETLRKLYRRRREYYQQAQLNEACRYVATEIGGEWKRLYECLPFDPNRNSDKRLHDIELIDMISARRDKTVEEQALKCLEKWRTFNRKNADVAQLIRGLRKLRKEDLADKVEMRFSIENVSG